MTYISVTFLLTFIILAATSPWLWSKKVYFFMWFVFILFISFIEIDFIKNFGLNVVNIFGYFLLFLALYVPIKMCNIMRIPIQNIQQIKYYDQYLEDNSLTDFKYKYPKILGGITLVFLVLFSIYLYSKGIISE